MGPSFWDAVINRRSYYGFGQQRIVPHERIEAMVKDTLLYVPSAYNSQTTRIVILFEEEHQKFWHFVLHAIAQMTDERQYSRSEEKIRTNFASGYGTLLFYEDQQVVQQYQHDYPLYADQFPVWSEQANAMAQYVVWCGLTAEGLGCSLQHYHPIVAEAISRNWQLPTAWELKAQMPFGEPLHVPEERESLDPDMMMRIFGGSEKQ